MALARNGSSADKSFSVALSGAVFVDRKNRKAAVQALEQAGDDMKKRGVSQDFLQSRDPLLSPEQVSLWVFPEGTRSSLPEPTLLPFKKGAFHLAVQAQVPIVPIVCENYHRLFDGKTRMEEGVLRVRGEYIVSVKTTRTDVDRSLSLATNIDRGTWTRRRHCAQREDQGTDAGSAR